MKIRQYRSNQGRNPKNNIEIYKLLYVAYIGLVLTIIFLAL